METFEDRLRRFLSEDVHEVPATILNAIHNNFLPQLHEAGQRALWDLVLLGTHAIMQTVGETIFGLKGTKATNFFLREFVDANPPDRIYSSISNILHDIRNVLAHQWMSSLGQKWGFDFTIPGGFEWRDKILHFNPAVYLNDFTAGFDEARIFDYENLVSDDSLLIRKYEFIAEWLKLPKGKKDRDPVWILIQDLEAAAPGQDRDIIENDIQTEIRGRYSL